jgi:isocitrate dehydrogenase
VYPKGHEYTYCTDHWRCRFISKETVIGATSYEKVSFEYLLALMHKLSEAGFDIIKTENLYEFDGKRGFSLGQGE